ncbi:MAG: hypothetical protein KDE19_16090 [Caldilineaceae bacterium]|nr:hypothetical protein [Caldilineaceae bacterium]
MQNLESLRNRGQETVSNLIERGKQQPDEVKLWGITAAAGVGGALTVAAVAKGVLAIVAALATPPLALTIGAVGGGALGWTWMQKQSEGVGVAYTGSPAAEAVVDTAGEAVATTDAVPETPAPFTAADDTAGETAEGSA